MVLESSGSDFIVNDKLSSGHGAPPRKVRASDELLPSVSDDPRKLAGHRLAQLAPEQILQPTSLVHEARMHLAASKQPTWENRTHFFSAAAEVMRHLRTLERNWAYAKGWLLRCIRQVS